jgi:hypothetical protein
MITAIAFIIIGILSLAGGLNLIMLALSDSGSILWLMGLGSIGSGLACLVAGFSDIAALPYDN